MKQGQALSELTDEQLWLRYQQGDHQALEVVHQRLGPQLLSFLASKCQPPLDKDDALQETLRKAMSSCQQYDRKKCRLIAWLITIAKNVVTDLRRKRHDEESMDVSPWAVAPESEPDDPRLDALRDCMKELGGDFVEVLRQHFLNERSFEDIAREMKINTMNTVYSKAGRGKKAVQDCVEKKLS